MIARNSCYFNGVNIFNTLLRLFKRVNSIIKEDLKIIDKPIVYNKQRADILAQIAAIALLLYRAFAFIIKISMLAEKVSVF